MKKSYLIYAPIALANFLVAISIAGNPLIFVDPLSIFLVVAPPLFILLAIFGPKGIIDAFKFAFEKSQATKRDLEKGIIFFSAALKLFLLDGLMGTLTGILFILNEISKTGNHNIAFYFVIAFMTLYYSLFIVLIVILPFKTALEKRIVDFE